MSCGRSSFGRVVLVGLFLLVGGVSAGAAPGVAGLRTEYLLDPVGIDVTAPQFSWQMTSVERGAEQSGYQVQVATAAGLLGDASGHPDVWDSGRVASAESLHVAYAGPALESQR